MYVPPRSAATIPRVHGANCTRPCHFSRWRSMLFIIESRRVRLYPVSHLGPQVPHEETRGGAPAGPTRQSAGSGLYAHAPRRGPCRARESPWGRDTGKGQFEAESGTRQKRRADHGCWTRPPRFRGKPLTHLRWRTAPLVAHAEESCAVGMPYTRGELRSIITELLDAGAVHAA